MFGAYLHLTHWSYRNSEDFFLVADGQDAKKLQNQIEELANIASVLEVDLKSRTVQLESCKKLHRQEIEFKDRYLQRCNPILDLTSRCCARRGNKRDDIVLEVRAIRVNKGDPPPHEEMATLNTFVCAEIEN